MPSKLGTIVIGMILKNFDFYTRLQAQRVLHFSASFYVIVAMETTYSRASIIGTDWDQPVFISLKCTS